MRCNLGPAVTRASSGWQIFVSKKTSSFATFRHRRTYSSIAARSEGKVFTSYGKDNAANNKPIPKYIKVPKTPCNIFMNTTI